MTSHRREYNVILITSHWRQYDVILAPNAHREESTKVVLFVIMAENLGGVAIQLNINDREYSKVNENSENRLRDVYRCYVGI